MIHVLNGDATVPEFQKSGIPGTHVVWREVMCEGPIHGDIKSDEFWDNRSSFIGEGFGGDYQIMRSQLKILQDISAFEEVVLWFEYDLFCQVNLLASLAYVEHPHVSLVCLGDELNGTWQGLGEIGAGDFQTLFEARTRLNVEDMSYADQAWQAYQHPSSDLIHQLEPHQTFPYLERALEAHLTRLPDANGLNVIEHRMLQKIDQGVRDERQLIGSMLKEQEWFGFGDLQYLWYFEGLKPLLAVDELALNEKGKSILSGQATWEQPAQFIGGIYRPDYFKLLKHGTTNP